MYRKCWIFRVFACADILESKNIYILKYIFKHPLKHPIRNVCDVAMFAWHMYLNIDLYAYFQQQKIVYIISFLCAKEMKHFFLMVLLIWYIRCHHIRFFNMVVLFAHTVYPFFWLFHDSTENKHICYSSVTIWFWKWCM